MYNRDWDPTIHEFSVTCVKQTDQTINFSVIVNLKYFGGDISLSYLHSYPSLNNSLSNALNRVM